MEFQFTIPLSGLKGQLAPSSSSRAETILAARGGTHRFALESRQRHTRRSSSRVRTGCSTCKKRHVKCDEAKPSCLNCIKWRGHCDGYSQDAAANAETHSIRKMSRSSLPKLIHTKKAPLILTEPSVNTNRFFSADQRAYFDEWAVMSMGFLSGGLGHAKLWTTTMPQLSLEEKTLRYGAMAVGALRKSHARDTPAGFPDENSRHYFNALDLYCEALRLQSQAKPSREGLRTALLSSLLFIAFESQRGNVAAALKHMVHGFSMLNELAACSDRAPALVSIAPAPPAMVQEILDCYKPLELQSRSFMGSYKKAFADAPAQGAATAGTCDGGAHHNPPAGLPEAGSARTSPPRSAVRPEETLPQTSTPRASPTGVPSPRSQDNASVPSSRASQASPTGQQAETLPPVKAGARPPRIAPFTKHSPYFRPRQSNITSLNDMPRTFQTYDVAQGYWTLLQKQMVEYLPLLTQTTAQLSLHEVTSDEELSRRLASVKQIPKMAQFVAESEYSLQKWAEAFEPYYQDVTQNQQAGRQAYLQACSLRIEYLILCIYTAMPRFSGLATSKGLTPQYREIVKLCEVLLGARPTCGFAMDSGWTWPLFVSAFSCRDAAVREEAIQLLGRHPIRNALRDSRVYRAIALKNHQVETENAMEQDEESEQWLRLRRREIMFEDFGSSIIYRYAKKDAATGRWRLVEEQASHRIGPGGLLAWKEQPLSQSLSILSGVC